MHYLKDLASTLCKADQKTEALEGHCPNEVEELHV